MTLKDGDLVTHKLTGKQMIVLCADVVLPNFPFTMTRCRFELPTGTFGVDHFTKEELIKYDEENLTIGDAGDTEAPKDLRKGK